MATRIVKQNLEFERGDTWRVLGSFTKDGANFAGCTVAMQMRTDYDDTPATSFTVSNIVTSPATSLTFVSTLAKTTTATLTEREYVYDVEVTYADATTQTIAKGTIKVYKDATHA